MTSYSPWLSHLLQQECKHCVQKLKGPHDASCTHPGDKAHSDLEQSGCCGFLQGRVSGRQYQGGKNVLKRKQTPQVRVPGSPSPAVHCSQAYRALIGSSAQLLVSPGFLAPLRWQRKGLLSSHLTLELLIPHLPRFLLSYSFPRGYLQSMGHWSRPQRNCWGREPPGDRRTLYCRAQKGW